MMPMMLENAGPTVRRALLVACVAWISAACGSPQSSGAAGDSATTGVADRPLTLEDMVFAFSSGRDGNIDIVVARGPVRPTTSPAGSVASPEAVTAVTTDPAFDGFPAWSPDGSRIAFDSDRTGAGNREVYTVAAGGGPVLRLTDDPGFDFLPAWSPDGEWIAFVSTRDSDFDPAKRNFEAFSGEIYRIRPDGTALERLTTDPAHDQAPAWSADGQSIAWCRDDSGQGDIWVMRADGRDPRPLVATQDFECSPAFSPDGRWLAWRVTRADSSWIMVAGARGESPYRLDTPFPAVFEPGWSSDSHWICFTAPSEEDAEDLDIWAVPVAGGTPVLLAGGPGRQQACAFQPAVPEPGR